MKNIYDVIIVGSGAAGFASADYLYANGVTDICIVTEGVAMGTSRNTGSDKQTYYKPDICSDEGDSVRKMAEDLFAGGSVNGPDALIEAASSLRCFMHLVELGVPFPTDAYGRYAGYRTDHDHTKRATSAGPLTSKYMTECLQKRVSANGTPILDGFQVIKLLVTDNVCRGVLCLVSGGLRALFAKAVILCTGAPAGIYSRSVYPESQYGATGLALEAGAQLANFQEWQYGIASVKFRWNLSGSYQQVVPRYVSVSPEGEEREFLLANGKPEEMYSLVFLKGYQWPFDSRKTAGSSKIDLLVFEELKKGNRVFLDYTKEPAGYRFENLSEEARAYLSAAECLAPTPFERLEKLNPKAVRLYLAHGIDLSSERLEISLCTQHNNGGIRTDIHSETSVSHLFAAGEAAGKFGVSRPGGAALNDTQVSALRAAEYLAEQLPSMETPEQTEEKILMPRRSEAPSLFALESAYRRKMSDRAGVFRNYEEIEALLPELRDLRNSFYEKVTVRNESEAGAFFRFRLGVSAMEALCRTVLASADTIGSRGGSVCTRNGKTLEENEAYRKYITVTEKNTVSFVPVEPVPDEHTVFEKLLKGEKE